MAKKIKKEKKTSRVKHKAFGTNVPGGLITQSSYCDVGKEQTCDDTSSVAR